MMPNWLVSVVSPDLLWSIVGVPVSNAFLGPSVTLLGHYRGHSYKLRSPG